MMKISVGWWEWLKDDENVWGMVRMTAGWGEWLEDNDDDDRMKGMTGWGEVVFSENLPTGDKTSLLK